jgi:hypothetical protein
MGMGSMSGRAAGYCGGFDAPGYANAGLGRGRGFGRGGGGGFGRRGGGGRGFGGPWRGFGLAGPLAWPPWDAAGGRPFDAEAERQVLRSRADALRAQLRAVESRIAEGLEKEEKPE